MSRNVPGLILLTIAAVAAAGAGVEASEEFTVNTGVDLYSRYIWRGMDFGNAPSIQPALSFSYAGFELGAWGAYTLSSQADKFDEIDFWLGYSREFESGASIGAVVTDYYLPHLGIGIFNLNDHDAVDANGDPDPGAPHAGDGAVVYWPGVIPPDLLGVRRRLQRCR